MNVNFINYGEKKTDSEKHSRVQRGTSARVHLTWPSRFGKQSLWLNFRAHVDVQSSVSSFVFLFLWQHWNFKNKIHGKCFTLHFRTHVFWNTENHGRIYNFCVDKWFRETFQSSVIWNSVGRSASQEKYFVHTCPHLNSWISWTVNFWCLAMSITVILASWMSVGECFLIDVPFFLSRFLRFN